jgi:translocation and assembly module TamB
LADLGLVTSEASGRLEASGRALGGEDLTRLTLLGNVATGRLSGKQLSDAQVSFEGTLQAGNLDGTLGASAFLDGVRVDLSSAVIQDETERRLSDLSFVAGGARLSGALTQTIATGLLDGNLSIRAADISTAAALALVEASGAVEADMALSSAEGRQNADLSGNLHNIAANDLRLAQAEFAARIEDLFAVPAIAGTLDARGLEAGGVSVEELRARADRDGEITRFSADALLADNVRAQLGGALQPEGEGFRVTVGEASLAQGQLVARLLQEASLLVIGDAVQIDGVALDVAGGRVEASGRVANDVDLSARVDRLPLSIANLIRPDLELDGTISGSLRATGRRAQPDLNFTFEGNTIRAAALRQAGQSAVSIRASGNNSGSRVTVNADVTSPEGLRATVSGSAPLDDGNLSLDVALQAFPLATLNAIAPGQDLSGSLTGSARITGQVTSPQASFDLRAAGVAAAPLRAAGIASLDASAAGRFADNRVTLTNATIAGPQGLSARASGTVPLSGPGLQLTLDAQAPLALANQFLGERGTQLSGTVTVNGTATGSIEQPVLRANFSTAGAQVVDPLSNLALQNINIAGSIAYQTVSITTATASIVGGGTISAGGTVSIDANAGFPADLRVALNQARYADGDLVVATVSGNLAFTGALTRDPLLSGQIAVDRAEISVPENFGGSAAAIDVIHRNPPPAVQRTLERARANDGTPTPTARPSVVRLDVTVNAPNRIFVRGRGLDAELGGTVRLTGPVTSIQPVGGFEMIRGRLGILGQRITFDEGTVTLVGDLDPFLNFVARSQSSDITVFITVSGRVSDLDISFSSQPELPEDEVLARLIFNRGIGELSALQIAQLAAAAAELAGGGNSSLLGSLREATGLDDLDVVTDSEGNAAVRAGRYIQENVYLGVEAGAQGTTRGTINLDITEELRARGSVGTDGDTSIGVFFERDY